MSINLYKVKRWGAGFLMAFVPTVTFLVMILTSDFIQAIIGFLIVTPLVIFIGFRILSHPLIDFLEGKGLLAFTFDSTGMIEPFIMKVVNPYLEGNIRGKNVSTIFNRDAMAYMTYPKKTTATLAKGPQGDTLTMVIPKEKETSIAFGMQHFPVLLFNKNLGEFITKDAFAKFESDTFVKHIVLYLNRKVEDLTSQLRDFARYIVEQTRPKKSIWDAGWVKWVIIVGVLMMFALVLAPTILQSSGGISGAILSTPSIVTPR